MRPELSLSRRRLIGSSLSGSLNRAYQDMRVAPFEPGNAFNSAKLGEVFGKPHQKFLAEIGMGDFPAAKLNDGFDAVTILEEPDGVILLEAVIVIVRVRAELQFLNLNHVLFLFSVVLLLFLLVLVVTVIDGLGDRGYGGRGDQNEVEAHLLRFAQGCRGGHHFSGPVGKNGAHFTSANQLVHVFSTVRPARWKISAGKHANLCCDVRDADGL